LRLGLVTIAVTLVGASGLLFDASTPRTVEVTLFYVAMVLVGFWLLQPKAPLALALLATLLIALGSWVSPPDPAPAWEAWTNRGLSVCAVWLAGVFVWRFRVIEQELRRSEERFRSSVVQSPVPTILYDDREQVLAVSRSWLNAAGGISANELYRLEDWTTIAYGERSGEMLDLVRRIIATEPEAQTDELVVRRRTGDNRVWHFVTSGLGAKSDGRHLFISVAQDVTDRKAYEERIELLMREARHRTKNILGLVQAVARQTAAREPEQFVESLSERIQALAANQDLLGRHEWQQIAVKDLVQVQLEHFDDLIGTRINFDGPNLHLNAAAAQSIGLALHELATNAGKYGALSTEAGRVDVSWQLDDDTYMMGWIERDGPLVQSPKRRGFGSTVIESMLQRALGGEVQLDYAPSGLQWRLTCPKANALELTDDSHNGGPA
jgi:PAS domain S-box-containing protein